MSLHPRVMFVGDRPTKDNIDPTVAFVGTKSYKTLLSWIADMGLDIAYVYLENAFTITGSVAFDRPWMPQVDKVVLLGQSARKAYEQYLESKPPVLAHAYFVLPHPSGLNRKLNDKRQLKKLLRECKEYIYSP